VEKVKEDLGEQINLNLINTDETVEGNLARIEASLGLYFGHGTEEMDIKVPEGESTEANAEVVEQSEEEEERSEQGSEVLETASLEHSWKVGADWFLGITPADTRNYVPIKYADDVRAQKITNHFLRFPPSDTHQGTVQFPQEICEYLASIWFDGYCNTQQIESIIPEQEFGLCFTCLESRLKGYMIILCRLYNREDRDLLFLNVCKYPHRVFQADVKDMAAEWKRVKEKAKEKKQFTSQFTSRK
jgi:hypothetical protein